MPIQSLSMEAFAQRWPSLGRACHYFFHLDPWDGELPGPRTRSKITSGKGPTVSYPTPELVEAIDRRAGWSDVDVVKRELLPEAMLMLQCYDPMMSRLVAALCVHGEVQQLPRARLRHLSTETIVTQSPFDGDARKMREWLMLSWELLAAKMATAKARKAIPVAGWARSWLTCAGSKRP